jgi:diadenosine tetraphosphate (Ap4A) HIT family hydrolase
VSATGGWATTMTGCAFCEGDGGRVLWRDERCRVVLTDEPFPGFCRVIWNAHVGEMTDLAPADRVRFVEVALAVESALRARLAPTKMNLASLGNVTPHLHWHVIPRFSDDTHFPAPVWAAPRRTTPARSLPAGFEDGLAGDLARALGAGTPGLRP